MSYVTSSERESPIEQGRNEEILYKLITTPWGGKPSNVLVAAYDATESFRDVGSAVLKGSSEIDGDVITLPALKSLSMGHNYYVEIRFTSGGDVKETHVEVRCVR